MSKIEIKKIFVSQPMRGLSNVEIYEQRKDIISTAREMFRGKYILDVIDSYIKEQPPQNCKQEKLWYLGNAITLLSSADFFVCSKNADFTKHPGCLIEKQCAELYDIPIVEV